MPRTKLTDRERQLARILATWDEKKGDFPSYDEAYYRYLPKGKDKLPRRQTIEILDRNGGLVRKEVERLKGQVARKMEEKMEITAEKVLSALGEIAFLDPADFYDKDGNLKSIHEMPKTARAALTGIDTEESANGCKTKKIKHEGKLGALTLLAKIKLMMPTDKVDVTSGGKPLGLTDEERAAQLAAIRQAIQERKENGG